jgi:hypothetical protein
LSLFAFFVLSAGAAAAAPPCERQYLPDPPYPATCVTGIDSDWYLTPGISRMHPDGVQRSVTRDDPPGFQAGTGPMAGMSGDRAIYLRGDSTDPINKVAEPLTSFLTYGGLERRIPLDAWRGKRLRLTVRLKNEGNARAYAGVQLNKRNFTAMRAASRLNKQGEGAWQAHSFVLEVPGNARDLVIDVGLVGNGGIWLDAITLEAVNQDVPVNWSERLVDAPLANHVAEEILPLPGPVGNGRPGNSGT